MGRHSCVPILLVATLFVAEIAVAENLSVAKKGRLAGPTPAEQSGDTDAPDLPPVVNQELAVAVETLMLESGLAKFHRGGSASEHLSCSEVTSGSIDSAEACRRCVLQPGCRYSFEREYKGCADLQSTSLSRQRTTHSSHRDIVGAVAHMVSRELDLADVSIETFLEDHASNVVEGLRATVWKDKFIDKVKKEMGVGKNAKAGFVVSMCEKKGYLLPGTRIQGEARSDKYYVVDGFLANGASKAIYKGRIIDADGNASPIGGRSQCVLKVTLSPLNTKDPESVGEVKREAVAQRYLNSHQVKDPRRRHVEELYDTVILNNVPVIVSEFVSGGMIGNVHHNKETGLVTVGTTQYKVNKLEGDINEMPEEWRSRRGLKEMLYQLLEGVEYISDRGFIHHDLHAQNAMFSQDPLTGQPVVKLIDFGGAAYVHVQPLDDTFGEEKRLRIDMSGQAANKLGPSWHDSTTLEKRFDTTSAPGILMCLARDSSKKSRDKCPRPDEFGVEIESAVPNEVLARHVFKDSVYPYMSDEFAHLTAGGSYCHDSAACRFGPMGNVHNTYDTVNVILDYVMMLMCTGDSAEGNPVCMTTGNRLMVPYNKFLDDLYEASNGDTTTFFTEWVRLMKKKTDAFFKIKNTFAKVRDTLPSFTAEEWEDYWDTDAAFKLPLDKPFLLVCPLSLDHMHSDNDDRILEAYRAAGGEPKGRWRRMYELYGIGAGGDEADEDFHVSGRSAVEAFRLWNYFDAKKSSPWADEVLNNPQFHDVLEAALHCDPRRRADAASLLAMPWFDDVRPAPPASPRSGRPVDPSLGAVYVKVDGLMRDRESMALESVLDTLTWDWAPVAVLVPSVSEDRQAPFVLPRRRVEIDLTDGKASVHGLDLRRHSKVVDYVKNLFAGGRTGSLDTERTYLYVLTTDYRLIIAQQAIVGDDADADGDRGSDFVSPGPYEGKHWAVRKRFVSWEDLVPGVVTMVSRTPEESAIPDDEMEPMSPAGHNALVARFEARRSAGGSPIRDRRTGALEGGSCRIARHHMATGTHPHPDADFEVGRVELTMRPAEWGQCSTPVRMAGTIAFEADGNQAAWVMRADAVLMIEDSPQSSSIWHPHVDQVRVLSRILSSLGISVDHLVVKSPVAPTRMMGRAPDEVPLHDDESLEVFYPGEGDVPMDSLIVMVLENRTEHIRRFVVECVPPGKRRWNMRQTLSRIEGELLPKAKSVVTTKQCRADAFPAPRVALDEKA